MLTEYFILHISETEKFFQANLQTENIFPQKTIATPLKLNGRSLRRLCSFRVTMRTQYHKLSGTVRLTVRTSLKSYVQ